LQDLQKKNKQFLLMLQKYGSFDDVFKQNEIKDRKKEERPKKR
jgi:hypothetical protein